MTRLTAQAYTVAWLCALPQSELVVATAMLDEEHDPLNPSTHDDNSYTYGSINGHNVIIACLPPGQPGKVSASKLVQPLSQSFPSLKIHLFVGIGAGVPRIPPPDDPNHDIHLGDVVIGWAEQTGIPGVVQWDLVRYLGDRNIEPLGTLDKPDRRILNALGLLLRNRILRRTRFSEHLNRLQKLAGFSHPGLEHDLLFKSKYHHVSGPNCSFCDRNQLTGRLSRLNQDLVFHQGTIVSGDTVLKDPQRRDQISQIYYGALCFEMEAAGVMDEKRCLVIRGIADYADSHTNSLWQNYAAATAAAFAREFLFTIQPQDVNGMESVAKVPLPSIQSDTSPTSAAKVHYMVPFQRNKDLIGREKYIQSLETKLCVSNKYCRIALVGLGGVGKTRIALEYASKHEKSDSVSVFWVHASTAERMEKAYQEIAKEARLVGADDPKVDHLQLVKQWLEGKDSGKWLMIIDNADDENVFFGEAENRGQGSFSFSKQLAKYFPQRPNGSILLTTRNRILGVKFATVRGVVRIPEMSDFESKQLVMENLQEGDYDDDDLTDLVEVLERLPLALVQAAAFIEENSQSINEYLQTYHGCDSSKIKLLSQNFEDSERDPDIKNPVAVTWAISFEQIKRNSHRAAELLSLMSVLDRQAIPKSLLSLDMEDVDIEIALGTLKAFSLITAEKNRQAFNLHRLVYLATRNWLSMNGELDFWTEKALVLLSKLFPRGLFRYRETWMAYLPHAQTILKSDYLQVNRNADQATLLFHVAEALEEKADYDLAEMMARESWEVRKKVLGGKNLKTLQSLCNLGLVLSRKGKNEEAEKINRQALNNFEETLGIEHPYTLWSLNNLGLVLEDEGKYEEAEKAHRRALSIKEETLGKEHFYTLGSVNNLAMVLDSRGKYEAAEELHRRALSAQERILGKEDFNTVCSVNNLGVVLANQRRHQAAEELHRRALSVRERNQGKEHPATLISVNNLGLVLSNQGQYEAAETLQRQALSGREKILGQEHPETLSTVHNLALTLQRQDQFEEAFALYQRALKGRERMLGKEHPDTLRSVGGLACLFARQREHQKASQLYQRALAGLQEKLGLDHPHTQKCADEYIKVLEDMGQDSEAPNTSVDGEDP